MIQFEPTTPSRSIGVNLDNDLIAALDDMSELMAENGVVPSRSEIARNLLWAGIAIVRSQDPRAAELLTLLRQDADTAA